MITHEIVNNVPIIFLEGDMTKESDEAVMSIYEKLKKTEGLSRLVFNFKKTNYINSAGIATLINVIQDMAETGGKVSFVGLTAHFQRVMDIVGILNFVEIYNTNEEALAKN